MEKQLTTTGKQERRAAKKAAKAAKQAKKKTIKLIPFLIFLTIIVALFLFRNTIVKTVITSLSETVSGARCDIEDVSVDILHSTLHITGYQLGDRNAPMTNLFSFDSLTCGININQLLYRRLYIDEVSITGFKIKSSRVTTAELPEKKSKRKEKKRAKATAFSIANPLTEFDYTPLLTELASRISSGITQSLPVTDATSIMNSLFSELQTPAAAQDIQNYAEQLIANWKDRPAEIQTQIISLATKVDTLSKITFSTTTTLSEIQSYLKTATDLYTETLQLQSYLTDSYNDFLSDGQLLNEKTTGISSAFTHDQTVVSDSITALTKSTIQNTTFLEDIFTSTWNSLLGEAKPLLDKALAIVTRLQSSSKKTGVSLQPHSRLQGTTYTWDSPKPTLYIGVLYFSGMGYTGEIRNITDNQQASQKATYLTFNHKNGLYQDEIAAILDFRGTPYTDSAITIHCSIKSPFDLTLPDILSSTISDITSDYSYAADATSQLKIAATVESLSITPVKSGSPVIDSLLLQTLQDIPLFTTDITYSTNQPPQCTSTLPAVIFERLQCIFNEKTQELATELNNRATGILNEYISSYTGTVVEFENIQDAYTQCIEMATNTINQIQKTVLEINDAVSSISNTVEKTIDQMTTQAESAVNQLMEDVQTTAQAAAEQAIKEAEKTAREAAEKAAADAEAAARKAAQDAASQATNALKNLFTR